MSVAETKAQARSAENSRYEAFRGKRFLKRKVLVRERLKLFGFEVNTEVGQEESDVDRR
ncbi:hypothetical protein L2W31_03365 [Dethiosulfovibrio acidaminovorans]|uniref:Uncharacterized protein n=1 Tax=Dethiosulfovibrio acidaminovorans TaxID=133535 RepID=A0ABS9ET02_9BACT|nr:hypothetical protein [Dethiosulfovibrio acidaminovorans]